MKDQRYIQNNSGAAYRVIRFSSVVAVMFFVLLARLWYLQVIETEYLKELSESNRLRLVPVAASRGSILDRNGKVLVGNTPSFSVAVVPQDVRDKEALVSSLARHIEMDPDELKQRWEKGKKRARYLPIVLASGITRDQLEYLEENRIWLPGIEIEMKPVRQYPNGLLAAHLLGYLSEISEQELGRDEFREYNQGDYVGKSGIERYMEQVLHGTDGGRQIEVDARGRFLRAIAETSPLVGNSVVLTIDLDVQQEAERAFGSQAGAAVAVAVDSGEVLAFASTPSFDPALFAGKLPRDIWQQYLEDKRHPLENKALKGQYPPGSTFKIITAFAGLEEGIIDPNTTVTCRGSYTIGKTSFGCWQKHGHGTVNLKRALRESCDVYFYQLGEKLGVDRIARYAREFGLGAPLGIGLENEKAGLIPTSEWKEKRYGKKWLYGETLPVSIGQGYVLATPIQLASMAAAIAGDGTLYRPFLVKRIVDPEGRTLKEFSPQLIRKTVGNPSSFRAVKDGLLAVVNEPGGTGGAARLYEVKVAGKTGTSQVVKLRGSRRSNAYEFRDHALFVAFAPYDKPEIAVAVVVEHGEHGGSAAAPIAGRMLRAYFEKKGVIRKPVSNAKPGEEEDSSPAAEPEERKRNASGQVAGEER